MGKSIERENRRIIVEYNPECTLCKLNQSAMNVCLQGDGSDYADIMIIGEAPGVTEDEEGKPFVGQAGRYLKRELLPPAGLDIDTVRFTNAVRCHPLKNKTPTINYIKTCRPYLEAEIRRIKPKVIVGMGNVPLASLLHFFYKSRGEEGVVDKGRTKVGGISKWRGHKIWLNEFNCWFVPTFHPSYAMRTYRGGSNYITDVIIKDLELAGFLANSKLPVIPKLKIHYLKKDVEINRMLKVMWDSGVYAFDIETGGTGNSDERWILGASFSCSETEGFFVDWENLKSDTVYKKFLKLVNSSNKLKVMHNGAYELRIFNFHNIPFNDRHFDTMLAAHLLDENFEKKLKSLAWTETFYGGYDVLLEKYKQEHKIKVDYSKIDRKLLAKYGAMDAITTFILYKQQIKALKKQKLYPLFHNIVMPIRRVMSDVEYTGFKVDVARAQEVKKASVKAINTLEAKIYEATDSEFNINSTKQLSEVLFKVMKLKPYKKTKTGYSVDSETLSHLKVMYPDIDVLHYLSDRSYVRTMLATHISQAINFVWSDDRVHTHYNLSGAVSGRTSCSKPSIHNIPRDGLIRSLYMASEGHVLVDADLKSAELAYLAAVSGEETFIEAFEKGLDIHATTYRKMHNLPDDYIPTKEERRTGKVVNFGIIYGISPIGLAKRLECSIEEAEDFIEMYFEGLPKIAEYLEKQKRLVRTKGYVRSIFGRRRLLPLGLSDSELDYQRAQRQGMNSPIQGGAADYTYLGLIKLYKLLKKHKLGSKIVHSVHDCAITDTWVYEVEEVKECTKEAFETKLDILPIQMRVDIDVYKHWGEGGESRLQNIFNSINITI